MRKFRNLPHDHRDIRFGLRFTNTPREYQHTVFLYHVGNILGCSRVLVLVLYSTIPGRIQQIYNVSVAVHEDRGVIELRVH